MKLGLTAALLMLSASIAMAQEQQSTSSVVDHYLSLEIDALSACKRSMGTTKVAFPLKGGDAAVAEQFNDVCNGKPTSLNLQLSLTHSKTNYTLTIVEPGGRAIPIQLTVGKHQSVRLDQGEVDLALTEFGQ